MAGPHETPGQALDSNAVAAEVVGWVEGRQETEPEAGLPALVARGSRRLLVQSKPQSPLHQHGSAGSVNERLSADGQGAPSIYHETCHVPIWDGAYHQMPSRLTHATHLPLGRSGQQPNLGQAHSLPRRCRQTNWCLGRTLVAARLRGLGPNEPTS